METEAVSVEEATLSSFSRRPGILIVGPPSVGKHSILSRLVSAGGVLGVAHITDVTCHGWTVDTKYYTADVAIWVARTTHQSLWGPPGASDLASQYEAVIMVFDLSDDRSYVAVKDWASSVDLTRVEIRLLVGNKVDRLPEHPGHTAYRRRLLRRGQATSSVSEASDFGIQRSDGASLLAVGNDIEDEEEEEQEEGAEGRKGEKGEEGQKERANGSSATAGVAESAELEQRRRAYASWCADNGIEFVEACALNEAFDRALSTGGDQQGVARIRGALAAHMWPGLEMKPRGPLGDPPPAPADNGEVIDGQEGSSNSSDEDDDDDNGDSEVAFEYELLADGAETWDSSQEPWHQFVQAPPSSSSDSLVGPEGGGGECLQASSPSSPTISGASTSGASGPGPGLGLGPALALADVNFTIDASRASSSERSSRSGPGGNSEELSSDGSVPTDDTTSSAARSSSSPSPFPSPSLSLSGSQTAEPRRDSSASSVSEGHETAPGGGAASWANFADSKFADPVLPGAGAAQPDTSNSPHVRGLTAVTSATSPAARAAEADVSTDVSADPELRAAAEATFGSEAFVAQPSAEKKGEEEESEGPAAAPPAALADEAGGSSGSRGISAPAESLASAVSDTAGEDADKRGSLGEPASRSETVATGSGHHESEGPSGSAGEGGEEERFEGRSERGEAAGSDVTGGIAGGVAGDSTGGMTGGTTGLNTGGISGGSVLASSGLGGGLVEGGESPPKLLEQEEAKRKERARHDNKGKRADKEPVDFDELEKVMAEMASMRNNLSGMPDGARRELAAKAAMRMARLFGEMDESDDES
eukprot:jgi/Mesen1/5492/ME000276S04621